MEEQAGRQLGNYRLLRLLGQGGFADVYLAEHIHLNTLAAVKLLHTRLVADDVESFRREARMIAGLVHPNIVRVLDFGVQSTVPYLVLDYAPNGTLRQRHPKGSVLPAATVVAYVKQVAEALQYAHDQRLVHRDIKPENMLLGRRGEALLSDFGIALVAQSSNYPHTQNVAGTVAYMAPEQIQAHPRPASDQYSLGVVVYEWLCGSRPFQGSFSEIAAKHMLMPPPQLRAQAPAIAPAVEEVVMVTLQKDLQRRFPSVRAFALALEQANLQSLPATAVFPPAAPPPDMFFGPPGGRAQDVHVAEMSSWMYGRPQEPWATGGSQPVGQSWATGGSGATGGSRATASVAPTGSGEFHQPQEASRPFSYPAAPVTGSAFAGAQPQRRISRRALLVGGVGLVAASSGLTWYLTSRHGDNPFSSLASGHPFTNPFTGAAPVFTYSAQQDYVWAVDWSPDGHYIVSGSLDGTAQVWTPNAGQKQLSYRSAVRPAVSDDYVLGVTWSPDSKRVAIGFADGTAQVVDVAGGELLRMYGKAPAAPIYAVTWSPHSNYLAAASSDGSVRVYEVSTGRVLTTFTRHTDVVLAAAWSPDGKRIVSGSTDGKAKVWDPLTGQEHLNYTGHSGNVHSVAWSHDSVRIASTSWDRTAKVWEATTGHTLYTYSEQPVPQMMDVAAWSHDDRSLAVGGHGAYLRICEAQTGKVLSSFASGPAYAVAWSPDDTLVVSGGISQARVQIWKVR